MATVKDKDYNDMGARPKSLPVPTKDSEKGKKFESEDFRLDENVKNQYLTSNFNVEKLYWLDEDDDDDDDDDEKNSTKLQRQSLLPPPPPSLPPPSLGFFRDADSPTEKSDDDQHYDDVSKSADTSDNDEYYDAEDNQISSFISLNAEIRGSETPEFQNYAESSHSSKRSSDSETCNDARSENSLCMDTSHYSSDIIVSPGRISEDNTIPKLVVEEEEKQFLNDSRESTLETAFHECSGHTTLVGAANSGKGDSIFLWDASPYVETCLQPEEDILMKDGPEKNSQIRIETTGGDPESNELKNNSSQNLQNSEGPESGGGNARNDADNDEISNPKKAVKNNVVWNEKRYQCPCCENLYEDYSFHFKI